MRNAVVENFKQFRIVRVWKWRNRIKKEKKGEILPEANPEVPSARSKKSDSTLKKIEALKCFKR